MLNMCKRLSTREKEREGGREKERFYHGIQYKTTIKGSYKTTHERNK